MRCNSGKCLILVMTIGLAAASAEGSQKPGSSDEGFRKGETRATPDPFLILRPEGGCVPCCRDIPWFSKEFTVISMRDAVK
jgi:hypothetical protein